MDEESCTPDPDYEMGPDTPYQTSDRDLRLACIHAAIQASGGQCYDPSSAISGAKAIYDFVCGKES
jgi:hypothetical protein